MGPQDSSVIDRENGWAVENNVVVGPLENPEELLHLLCIQQFRRIRWKGAAGQYVQIGQHVGPDRLADIRIPDQKIGQAGLPKDVHGLMECRPPDIGVYEQDPLPLLREHDGEVDRRRGLSFVWTGAREDQGPDRLILRTHEHEVHSEVPVRFGRGIEWVECDQQRKIVIELIGLGPRGYFAEPRDDAQRRYAEKHLDVRARTHRSVEVFEEERRTDT